MTGSESTDNVIFMEPAAVMEGGLDPMDFADLDTTADLPDTSGR